MKNQSAVPAAALAIATPNGTQIADETQATFQAYYALNSTLCAFMDHELQDVDYSVQVPGLWRDGACLLLTPRRSVYGSSVSLGILQWMKLEGFSSLVWPLVLPTVVCAMLTTCGEDDSLDAMAQCIVRGCEYSLIIFETLLFCCVDLLWGNHLVRRRTHAGWLLMQCGCDLCR